MRDPVQIERSDLWVLWNLAAGHKPVEGSHTPEVIRRTFNIVATPPQGASMLAPMSFDPGAFIDIVTPEEECLSEHRLDPFQMFWLTYPRKVGKRNAMKVFDRLVLKEKVAPGEIIDGAQRFADHWADEPKDRKQFIPYPATWLNAGSWEDELVPHATTSKVDATRRNLVDAAGAIERGESFADRMARAGQRELES